MEANPNLILELVGNLGAIGIVLWLVVRTTNHTIPRLAKQYEDGLEKQRSDSKDQNDKAAKVFETSLEKQREDYKTIANQSRQDHLLSLKDHREFFGQQIERERASSSENTKGIIEAIKELKTEIKNG